MLINKNLRKYLLASVSAGAMISSQSAHANPDGATVVTGDVSINGIGTDHVIVENDSLRSVVDWNSFSIGTGETTTINQITNDAAILNRVTGGDITEIYGTLESNGQVFLINRSGILIGETGIVDTNGFVASTLDLPNADFLGAGDMLFSQGVEAGGGITVHGKIRSVTGGDIFLLSREIEIGETGEINSNGGYVGLGAGEEILLKPTDTGDGRISIRAGQGKIINRGQIEGAAAELRAAGGNAYALAINNTGVVRATGVSKSGGRVMLTGGGKVRNTGRIVARKKVVVRSTKKITNSGTVKAGDGNKGGEIIFEAPEIEVQTGSLLDVSGALGGGRMFIGGGYRGSGNSRSGDLVDITQNAQLVTIETGAVLNASATESGDAGEVIAWADDTTVFAGDIVATAVDGKGGFAEVSGREVLSYQGVADLRSGSGEFGTLLLDPGSFAIFDESAAAGSQLNTTQVDNADADGPASADGDGDGIVAQFDADDGDGGNTTIVNAIGDDTLSTNLGVANVTIATATNSANAADEDILFTAGTRVLWTADTTLQLEAGSDIHALDDVRVQHAGVGAITGTDGIRFLAVADVNIGDAGVTGTMGVVRTDGVAIGSEHGQTTIMAGDSDFNGSADLATGDLNVIGGDASGAYAHIGFIQGGAAAVDANGNITAEAGNAVNLTGGTAAADSFALIGHGGDQSVAAMAGITNSTITVTAGAGGVNLLASYTAVAAANNNGPDSGGVQIGHGGMSNRGGASSMGDISGNINVSTRAGTAGTININAGALNGAIDANDQMAAARIGHGSYFNVIIGPTAGGYTQGAISGTVDVTADGALTLGHDQTLTAGDGNAVIVSQIGHGAVGAGNSTGAAVAGTSNYTFGNIRGATGGATDVTVRAASVLAQANTTSTDNSGALADEDLVNNVQRSQIGHGSFLLTNESDATAAGNSPLDVVVTEGRISGDIEVYDTNGTDARGITVTSSVTEGDAPATLHDMNIARIGHATSSIIGTIDGGTGAAANAFRGGNATIYQAHILDAHITVDTVTRGDGAGGAAGDSFEANNQDITVSANVAAGNASVQDNTVVAQIGHGGDVVARTGDGADAIQNVDGDAGDGGDITIYKGTVWDGGLVRDNDADDLDSLHSMDTTDITVLSSNEVIVTSTSAAALASAERNSSESQIGHGHRIRVVTGDGGDGGNTGRDGGAGGDILVLQSLDAREYGIDQANGLGEYDDYAYGLRGDITITARETDGVDGTNAISMTSSDTSANAGALNNSDYSVVGHSDVIELVSGNGGNGGGLGAGGADSSDDPGDTNTADPFGQITAHGGRGGHIDVQLGRLRVDQDELVDASDEDWHERGDLENRFFADMTYANRNNAEDFNTPYNTADLGDKRDGARFLHSNAQADARLQGVMLTEGDITINTIGRVVLDSSANNALSASTRSITESVIGHGQRAFTDSGDGGNGGSANFNSNSDGQQRSTVFQSEIAGEQFINYASGTGSNRGGNGGDNRLTQGDITDRQIANRIAGDHNEIYHDTDADHRVSADIFLNIRDTFTIDINGATVAPTAVSGGADLPDSLVLTSAVNAGLAEGTGNDVLAGVGHHVRLFAEGGIGGDGGSTNTEFDDDSNSLFVDGTGQADTQGAAGEDGVDETPDQAGAVHIQPNSSGGRGGDALVINDNINGNIVVNADRRVTIATTAGHGTETLVVSGIGHNTYVFAATQNGGVAGNLYEEDPTGATFDGGIINVNGTQTGANAGASSFAHVLIDGNQDDKFNLVSNGDSISTDGEDGIAVTPDDIANREGSTIQSINDDFGVPVDSGVDNAEGVDIYTGAGDNVIFHDEEADPEFILDNAGNLVLNNEANNTLYTDAGTHPAAAAANLARFGRVVATYDQHDPDADNELGAGGDLFDARAGTTHATRRALQVFVDMDRDGDVDLVDFDRDGRLDIVDVDNDGFMDVIDGRANYVDSRLTTNVLVGSGIPNGITGLGVLDYVAVTGVGYTADQDQNWSLTRQLTSVDLLDQYHLGLGTRDTALVGDFSTANGGRGGDAYTHTGYSIGDISISTGNNDLGEATSLAVTVNLTDDVTSNAGFDTHVASVGHSAYQWSDAAASTAANRNGREGLQGDFDTHVAANGGNAGQFAINANGGRGGDGLARQGERRDVNPSEIARAFENDHFVGNIWINTPNALDNSISNDAKQILVDSFVDTDYGDNLAIAALGHHGGAASYGGNGGNGVSVPGGEDGSSQTELANGGRGGYVSVLQEQVKGFIEVMTGADDADGSQDYSFVMRAENGAATTPGGPRNTIISQVGHGRLAEAIGGVGGTGDDGQWYANGGDGGDAVIIQNAVIDTYIDIDLVEFTGSINDPNGYFGNGMSITANVFENSDNTVRAQVGHGDLAVAYGGNAGNATPDWNVNEQRNQTANGGEGGDATITQTGYAYDITLDIGFNSTSQTTPALLIQSSADNVNTGQDNHILASVGHGGVAATVSGNGGNGGLSGAVNGIQTLDDPNYVDSDYNYTGAQTNGDTPYDIDEDGNRLTLGTDRRGGDAGDALTVINNLGTGRILTGRAGAANDYGRDDTDGAGISLHTNDRYIAGSTQGSGFDGIVVRSISGGGTNQDDSTSVAHRNNALLHNTALVGHHGFATSEGGAGGDGIQSGLSATISEGDGGDGGTADTQIGAVWGDVTISNLVNPIGGGDSQGVAPAFATDIIVESVGGGQNDNIRHRAESRVGHLTHGDALAGAGGNASKEAGSNPSFPATISAQGGDGGDALSYQGQLAGDINMTAENSITFNARDDNTSAMMTVAATGHRMEGRAIAADGGFGGTYAGDGNAQSVYFTYEALREFHARGGSDAAYGQLSMLEQKLVDPVRDYFENKPGELGVFLDNLTGADAATIAANARDADQSFQGTSVGGTAPTFNNYSIAPLVDGSGHISGSDDGEIETLSAILAASGHGGNAVVVQGSVGLNGSNTDELAASGNIVLDARSGDTTNADRGVTFLAQSNALSDGMQLVHGGHQAEVIKVTGGVGQDLIGANAGANGIGGDGGDAIVDQYALNGGIDLRSNHEILIRSEYTALGSDETRAWVGHRLTIGQDFDNYRTQPIVEAGKGGSESNDTFDDGHNGNGGDVFVWQRGVQSGRARAGGGTYDTEIQISALQDSDDHSSIIIDARETATGSGDVETHVGHDILLVSAKAGDAGRQGGLTGPNGAAEGLLEGNGGDIFIHQSDLGADIDIVGRDDVALEALSTLGGNSHLIVGHERTIGLDADTDNPRGGTIIAGFGGDAHTEQANASDLASIEAAAAGIATTTAGGVIEDGDSGRIEITLGIIGDSFEDAQPDGVDDDERLLTITSITEDVTVLSNSSNGSTSVVELGNQQQVWAQTGSAAEFNGVPLVQTAGDAGGVYIARDDMFGDILVQAIDADRANSEVPANGKQVVFDSVSGTGATSINQVGHETEFVVMTSVPETSRAAFGEDRNFLFTSNLTTFTALIDPTTVPDTTAGQATLADAQNAVEDMDNIVRVLQHVVDNYADRFPADDGNAADRNDQGDLNRYLQFVINNRDAARAALASIGGVTVEDAVSTVMARATDAINNSNEFQTILNDADIPNANELFADPAKGGDIVYGNLTSQNRDIATIRTLEPKGGLDALNAQGRAITDTGVVRGNTQILSGTFTNGGGINLANRGATVGNDTIIADVFGTDDVDNIDDGVVQITATSDSTALTEIGHRRDMTNTTSFGGGDSNANAHDGGVAGDAGSITTRNTTSGDVTVRAEEVVINVAGAAGTGEVHFLHSSLTKNTAGWSDIQTLMGNGGDITNTTTVSGGVNVGAEWIATAVDAQDRTLQAAGLANTFLHFGHQVNDDNASQSDPNEAGNNGDSQNNLGSNRGGDITSTQSVSGNAAGDLVVINLNVNGSGTPSDLIVETVGAGQSDIRFGSGEDEDTLAASVWHRGVSGGQSSADGSRTVNITDDGGVVTLTQSVAGDIHISQIEDLEVRALGSADNDIWIGHDAEQFGQSGQVNNPPSVLQYGERVTVNQNVAGEVSIATTSSFTGILGASAGDDWHMGHEATQTAYSADDSANPSDFEDTDNNGVADGNGASAGGVNDDFDQPDIVANQDIQGRISIVTGEITLQNLGTGRLQTGHEAFHTASVDGDLTHSATDVNAPNRSTGHVVATSRINRGNAGDNQDDIIFTATGSTVQNDTVLAPVNGAQGDIQILNGAAGEAQVGHRSTSTMTDGPLNAEGQYNTEQTIGSFTDADGDGEIDDTSQAVIQFTAAQDILIDNQAAGTAQVGHYITEAGTLQTNPVDVDGDPATGLAAGDSELRQFVGSDIIIGDNTNQNSGGTGGDGAGNNFGLFAGTGRGMVGHMSPDSNQWQVEGMAPAARRVTVQLLDGDITIEAGTDADTDAPDGTVLTNGAAFLADETGTGDDIIIEGSAGEARVGHNQANNAEGIANKTQASAGDIWVRAGGDLHVIAGGIGHENYDFTTAPGTIDRDNALPASTIRDRIRGNTTIGAGQNSAPEDSTLIADIMKFDGGPGAVEINSGYGGQGDADVDGELRFFLPAQEGLTVIPGVTFNDSASNGDATFARTADPSNVFEGQGGNDHEHDFTFMAENAPYTDQFIGLGNFTFYFESSAESFPEYTPYINEDDFESGYTIIYTRRSGAQRGEGTVNIGRLGGSQYFGTGSHELACEEQVTPPQGIDPEGDCEEVRIHFVGQQPGFGSNTGFSGTAGGNQGFARNFDFDQTHVDANGGNSGSSSSNVVFGTELGANPVIEISYPVFSFNTTTVEISERELARKPVKKSDLVISQVSTYSGSIIHYDVGNTYGEYVEGAEVARRQVEQQYPGALSYASTFTVYQEKQL